MNLIFKTALSLFGFLYPPDSPTNQNWQNTEKQGNGGERSQIEVVHMISKVSTCAWFAAPTVTTTIQMPETMRFLSLIDSGYHTRSGGRIKQ